MNELLKRILFAIPAGAGFIVIMWLGSYYFVILLLLLMLIGQYEINGLARKAGLDVNRLFLYILGIWSFSLFLFSGLIWGGLLVLGALVATELFLVDNRGIGRLTHTVFWGLYGPLGFGAFLWIRQQGADVEGFALALSFLLMIWFNDIMAYLGGKYLGKHAMAPDISPNKTWEGFVFGIIGAVIGLFLTQWIVTYPLSNTIAVPMALLSGVAGPVGDLTQSRLKRVAGVKDASNIFPGHGGVWDRFDAMILTTLVLTGYLEILKEFSVVTI